MTNWLAPASASESTETAHMLHVCFLVFTGIRLFAYDLRWVASAENLTMNMHAVVHKFHVRNGSLLPNFCCRSIQTVDTDAQSTQCCPNFYQTFRICKWQQQLYSRRYSSTSYVCLLFVNTMVCRDYRKKLEFSLFCEKLKYHIQFWILTVIELWICCKPTT